MKIRFKHWLLSLTLVGSWAAAQPVTRIIVPFPAGGGTDVYVRLVAAEVSKAGMPVVVDPCGEVCPGRTQVRG